MRLRWPVFTLLAIALVWGIFAVVERWSTVGAMALLALSAGITAVSLLPRRSQVGVAVATVAFLPWLLLRSSPWLLALDVLAFFALFVQSISARTSVTRPSLGGYLAQWGDAVEAAFVGPLLTVRALFGHGDQPKSARRQKIRAVGRAAIVPALVAVVVIAILASGDALFASYLTFDVHVSDRFRRGLPWAIFGVMLFTAAVGVASRPPGRDKALAEPRAVAPPQTVLLTLIVLAITIGLFGSVQLSGALLGEAYVTERTGLSYAEWARQGFFQLVVVTTIAAIALGVASVAAAHHFSSRRKLALASTAVAAAIVALVVASYIKLAVYTDQYGLTMLRFYTMTFAIWLGVVAVIMLVSVVRPGGRWVTTTVLTTALVGAFAMNVINPERRIVEHNLDRVIAGKIAPGTLTGTEPGSAGSSSGSSADPARDEYSDRFDARYVSNLSGDGLAVAFERLDDLPPELRTVAVDQWCGKDLGSTDGLNYNVSVRAAAVAQRENCN